MLAGGEKSRVDSRMTAMLPARMRDAQTTRDVKVGDLSPKGMLVVCGIPPERGAIVEIVVNGHHLAGEVRWVSGRRIGLRMRERVPVADILSGRPPKRRIKGKKIEASREPKDWALPKLVLAYSLLGLTAFATAYLIVTYVIL